MAFTDLFYVGSQIKDGKLSFYTSTYYENSDAVYGKNSNSDRWFPLCYVYDGEYDTIFQKTASTLISREIAERWMKVFGYSTLEEFKQKIAEVNELIQKQVRVRRGDTAAFTETQLLGDFIKPDDLGRLR